MRDGWKHLKQLQDATQKGYNKLSGKEKDPDNSFINELVVDLIQIGIGLSIYIQLDIKPYLPFDLPDVIQHGSFRPIVAMTGFAIACYGGLMLLFALVEAATWTIGGFFRKQRKDD